MLGGKKVPFYAMEIHASSVINSLVCQIIRSQNFIYLLTQSPQVMTSTSLEMLEEKYTISFGVILLIGMFFLLSDSFTE